MSDVAIVGAGYVGLPLGQIFAEAGRSVVLVETNEERVARIGRGESYIDDVGSADLKRLVDEGKLGATSDYDAVRAAKASLFALATPLSKQREPDLSVA